MSKGKGPEQTAAERYRIIGPLLDEALDRGKFIDTKKDIAARHEISVRSVGRYYEAYQKSGFEGLKPTPPPKRDGAGLPENYQDIVNTAVELRRESVSRSVADIIKIMEMEGIVGEGALSRSTLQRHLQEAGFGAKQFRRYTTKGAAAKRFQKQHRCILWQGDIKFGPYLPIGENGQMAQTYLVAWIDDCTRFIVSAKFYDNQRVEVIEDSLRNAVMKYGIPVMAYVDNGKQYRSEWLATACAKTGIKLIFTKPYSPESKGKIEFFNKRINSFLSEAALSKATTLDEYNKLLTVWIEQYYHKNPHSGLGGISPETMFKSDARSLCFVDSQKLRDAFLHSEERDVDKVGCINLNGFKYEVGTALIGRKVEVLFDNSWKEEVEIHHKDFKPFMARKLVIGSNCGVREELPENVKTIVPESSRLLDGLKEQHEKSHVGSGIATTFKQIWEDLSHV